MQDKLMEQLKKLSFMTAHPDADWARIFAGTILIVLVSAVWSAYLYVDVQSGIQALDGQASTATIVPGGNDELKTIVGKYEEKRQKYDLIKGSKAVPLPDPAAS